MSIIKQVTEVCVPRSDIITGRQSDAIYAADLALVRDGKAPPVYQDPSEFFRNTYPTDGLKTTISEVFSRLAGREQGSPVIKLETSLGGGKTHSLISLYHIAKGGSSTPGASEYVAGMTFKPLKVATIIGSELSVVRKKDEPLTIWGILAKELVGSKGYDMMRGADEQISSPGEKALRELLGKEKCLILIDEMAIYLAKAATVMVGDSDLAKQTAVFLQELSNVANSLSNVVMVITSLDKEGVFRQSIQLLSDHLDEEARMARGQEAIGDADKVLSRVVKTLTPTKGEEFSAVVLRRLFDSIDDEERKKVCQVYMKVLSADSNIDYLPGHARNVSYLKNLESSYPFHPELINILRTKTSSIPNFNKTRGVLRLLSKVVRNTWNEKSGVYLIHPYAVDMRRQEFVEEIVSRLDRGEYQSAIAADISNRTDMTRAARVDELFQEPLGTMICNVVFLHSITGARATEASFGVSEPEIHLALARPDLDLKKSEDALKALENNCFYLVRHGSNFAFSTEPNLNKIIEVAKDNVEQTRVVGELEDRLRSMYGGKRFFVPVLFANEPSMVSDDTDRPKLVVMHFRDCSMKSKSQKKPPLVISINERSGSMEAPRVYANNLLFLLADEDEIAKMDAQARSFLALSQLKKDVDGGASYLAALTTAQKDRLNSLRKEGELYLKIAVMVCYKHLLLPWEQSDLESSTQRPLRHLEMRVSDTEAKNTISSQKSMEEAIVEVLRNNRAALTNDDKPLSPEFVLDELWDKKRESYPADEFRKLFYKRPTCGLVLTDELIRRSLKEGLEQGRWVVLAGGDFYDKTNPTQFFSALDNNVEIILAGTERHLEVRNAYYCAECKRRKKDCVCIKGPGGRVEEEKCPRCGQPILECMCHQTDIDVIKIERKSLIRGAGDLPLIASEKGIDRFSSVQIKAGDREALVKMLMALPQLGKVNMTFQLSFSIKLGHMDGNNLTLNYEGNKAGVDAIRSIIVNYEAKQPFSSHDLVMELSYPDGISVKEFCDTLGENVGKYTGEALFSIVARSMDVI